MKSRALPGFWDAYDALDKSMQKRARKAFELWAENPFHPSLHFKCINSKDDVWSVRISLDIRALGVMDGDTVTWFWVGSHDEYERYYS